MKNILIAGQAADEPNDQPSKVAKRNFQDAWFVSHVWLVIVEEGGFTKLSCGTCRRAIILRPSASINRGLGAKPTTNFKIDVLREHELSTEHMAVCYLLASKPLNVVLNISGSCILEYDCTSIVRSRTIQYCLGLDWQQTPVFSMFPIFAGSPNLQRRRLGSQQGGCQSKRAKPCGAIQQWS